MFCLTIYERSVLCFIGLLLFSGAILKIYSLDRAFVEADANLPKTSYKDTTININTASFDVLSKISGIGPKCAQRILEYRTNIRYFYSYDDLLKVKGVSRKSLSKFKDRIKFYE